MSEQMTHPARADARDNRARILDAARAVFGEEGLGAPMREVARHAGVGPATLYRHFPTKRDLVLETYAEQRRVCRSAVHEALAHADPGTASRTWCTASGALHAESRGFADAFMAAFPEAMDFAADREQAVRAVAELSRRAQRAGPAAARLRRGRPGPDAHGPPRPPRRPARRAPLAASRRYAAYVIEAFRAVPEGAAERPCRRPRLRG